MPHAVEFSQVSRSFGRVCAVDELSLAIPRGTATALLGANGAGKTTVLKLCATLLTPTSGKLRIAGLDPARDGAKVRASTALLGHDSHLYGDLTADENLWFTARLHGIPDARQRIDEALSRIGLRAVARRSVRTYSRGMQQRCALARVLVQRPELLLLDEPATGLDVTARDTFYEIVHELRRQGTTIVLTTHDIGECLALCDTAIVLAGGRIAWTGSVSEGARGALENRLRSPTAANG